MVKLILSIVGILVLVAVPAQAFVLGAEAGRPYVRRLFAEPAVLLRFFLATFVVMPGLAIAIAHSHAVPWPVWAGLLLMSITPPSIGYSKKATLLGCDTEICLGWQSLALVLSVVTIPLTLLVAERIVGVPVRLGIVPVVKKVLSIYLLPMVVGFLARQLWPIVADSLEKILKRIAEAAMALLVLVLLPVAAVVIVKQGMGPLLVVLAFVAVAVLVGHWMGGPPEELRPVLAATLAGRWIAPALVLAKVNEITREVAPTLITYVLGGTLLMILYTRWMKAHMTPVGAVDGGETRLAGTPRSPA
jgi:predicted Na+-dependent transporter